MNAAEELVASGRDAMRRNDWPEAYELLSRAASLGNLAPDACEDLAKSAWWSGRPDECIDAREQAYAGFMKTGEDANAALVALDLAESHFHKRAEAVGLGWVKAAERLLSARAQSVEHGYLARMKAVIAFEGEGDLERALELADRAYDIGARFHDRDLQALALHDRGRIAVARGDVEEGMAMMDEAMVAAVGGELGPLYTGKIYCNMIDICEQLADWRRAGDWSDAARRWCERAGNDSGFPGVCRIHRAEIMRLRGDWAVAEQEAVRASEELGNFVDFAGEAFYEIGEIRLHMGDFDQAEEAFKRAHALGREPEPGLAQLHLARGQPSSAWALIRQSLDAAATPLKRARLLPTAVEASLAAGELDTASGYADELDSIASEYRSPALIAAADDARGATKIAEGEPEQAVAHLRRAVDLWLANDIPYLAARSRMRLAGAYRATGAADSAALEVDAALDAFQTLGALADARAALVTSGRGKVASGRADIALMFTDIVDSTALIGVIGDDAWERLLRWHHRTLRSLFADHGGTEVENAGDGFFVSFPDAASAVECAIDIQRTLARQREDHGFAPKVRIGLHHGSVTATAGTLAGEEVHRAARIGQQAQAGEILASVDLAASVEAERLGQPRSLDAKGFAGPIEVVALRW